MSTIIAPSKSTKISANGKAEPTSTIAATSQPTIQLSVNLTHQGKLAEQDKRWRTYNGAFKTVTFTAEQLAAHVQAGYGFTSVLKGYRKEANFVSRQDITLDFDTKDERSSIHSLLQDPFIAVHAALLYTTASHTPEHPRARVVFFLDQPITDASQYKRLVLKLHDKYEHADKAPTNPVSLFFGAKGCETRVIGRTLKVSDIENLGRSAKGSGNSSSAETSVVLERSASSRIPEQIGEGARNKTLLSLAGGMRRQGANAEEILAALRVANHQRCKPPLEDEELIRLAQGTQRYKPHTESRPLTDLGNAERLIDAYGQDLRYSRELGWLHWDGRRWKIDDDGAVNRLMNAVVRAIRIEAANETDKDKSAKLFAHALRSEQATKLAAALKVAETLEGVPIHIDELDNGDWLINFRNGTLDLELNKLREHRREDYITKLIPCNFDPDADCPTFRHTIELAFKNNQALIDYMQEALGYSLSGTHDEKAIFILHGKSGNNGKSTVMESFGWALGEDYAGTVDPSVLMVGQKDSFRLGSIASMRGKRFISCNEMQAKQSLDPGTIKQWSGMDRIHGKDLYKKEFEFFQKGKLWIRTNDVPRISDNSDPLWNRLKLMPFNNVISAANGERPRAEIDRQLRKEREGILAWAYKGHLRWRQRGKFLQPSEITAEVKEYRMSQDVFSQFLEERYEIGAVNDKSFNVTLNQVVTDFRAWCFKESIRHVKTSNQEVRKMINQQQDIVAVTQDGQWHVLGLRLQPAIAQAEAAEELRRRSELDTADLGRDPK